MAYSSKRKTTVFESQTWDVLKTLKEDLLSASEKQPVTFCEILKKESMVPCERTFREVLFEIVLDRFFRTLPKLIIECISKPHVSTCL